MNKYMHLAILEARKGIRHGHGGPFGAVIVKNGEVIGKGHKLIPMSNFVFLKLIIKLKLFRIHQGLDMKL